MKVQVDKAVLAGYRRRALRRFPNEYMETIWGKVSKEAIQICAFYPIDHKGQQEWLEYEPADVEDQKERQDGPDHPKLQYLGSIHSHPDADGEPSEADWQSSRQDGERVMGIYQIVRNGGRKRGKVRFYSEPLQELEIT